MNVSVHVFKFIIRYLGYKQYKFIQLEGCTLYSFPPLTLHTLKSLRRNRFAAVKHFFALRKIDQRFVVCLPTPTPASATARRRAAENRAGRHSETPALDRIEPFPTSFPNAAVSFYQSRILYHRILSLPNNT